MRHILHKGRVLWKTFEDHTIDSYVGDDGEPIIDARTKPYKLRVCDGVTPGGFSIADSSLYGLRKPTVLAPINGARFIPTYPVITLEPFIAIDELGKADGHKYTKWELYRDPQLLQPVYNSGHQSTYLTRLDFKDISVKLALDTTYYLRITVTSDYGLTSVSSITSFTTTDIEYGSVINIDGDIAVAPIGLDWLVISSPDRRATMTWGLNGINTSLPDNPIPDLSTGSDNTAVLNGSPYRTTVDLDGTIGCPAAIYADFMGYSLPTREELTLILKSYEEGLFTETATDASALIANIRNSSNDLFWTSTEFDATRAMAVSAASADVYGPAPKSEEHWVIPVKRVSF